MNGWTAPAAGTERRTKPLDLVRSQLGVSGDVLVTEIRYFEGPELPNTEPKRTVKRWYVKSTLQSDDKVRGRFIVEDRDVGAGVNGVAPFTTLGFKSPDWRGFDGEGEPKAYPDIPGKWSGAPYDFVTGKDGPGPGLPPEATGCLDGI